MNIQKKIGLINIVLNQIILIRKILKKIKKHISTEKSTGYLELKNL